MYRPKGGEVRKMLPSNIVAPQEYHDLNGAIGLVNEKVEQLIKDQYALNEYDLPDGLDQRLRECIEWRIYGLNIEKQKYLDRIYEIEHELMGNIPD